MHRFLGSNNSGIAKRLNRMNNRLKCLHACQGYELVSRLLRNRHIHLNRIRASVAAGLLLLKFGEFELLTFEQCANPQSHGMLIPRCKYSNYS